MKPGTQVGHYLVERELSRGGQGSVYEARHTSLGTPVALKLLHDTDPDMRRRFAREARTLARLRHPNLLAVTDMGEVEGVPYMAMELVAGRDLQTELRLRGLFPPARAAEVLASVAETLHYCHEQGIVHRDVKPANVLIEEGSERIVLVDFGLIRRRGLQQAWVSQDRATLTQAGDVLGTPGYLAPEQIDPRWGEADRRADVYGLGATLYALLTGEPPFAGPTLAALDAVLSQDPPDPRRLRADLPRPLAELCRRCLSKDPLLRPATAQALAEELRACASGSPHAAPSPGKRWILASLALALSLAGGVVLSTQASLRQDAALAARPSPAASDPAASDPAPSDPAPRSSAASASEPSSPTSSPQGAQLTLDGLLAACEGAAAGDPDALRTLADHLLAEGAEPRRAARALVDRWAAARDPRAFAELERAAQGGSTTADAALGDLYSEGIGLARDDQRAVLHYQRAAGGGQVDGLHRLAMHYQSGRGVPRDLGRARALFRQAAERGFEPSAANLAALLIEVEDYAGALRWSRFAAEKKVGYGMIVLAYLYAKGFGTPRDWDQAWLWSKRAVAAGQEQGLLNLGSLANEREGLTRKQLEEAKRALRRLLEITQSSERRDSAQRELKLLEERNR